MHLQFWPLQSFISINVLLSQKLANASPNLVYNINHFTPDSAKSKIERFSKSTNCMGKIEKQKQTAPQ